VRTCGSKIALIQVRTRDAWQVGYAVNTENVNQRRRRRAPCKRAPQWGRPPLGCLRGATAAIPRGRPRPEEAIPIQGGAHEQFASFRAGESFRVPGPFLFCWVELFFFMPPPKAGHVLTALTTGGALFRMHTAVPPNFRCTYLSLMWHKCALEPPPKAGYALVTPTTGGALRISGALICLLCGISAHLSPLQKRAAPLQL
jgi:hypothetical protein